MKPEIRVLIADDHPMFRQGMRSAIEADPALRIVAEAGDGAAALKQIRDLLPDVAVLDMEMPVMSGIAVLQALQAVQPPVAVIFLTMHKDEHYFNAAFNHGALGYVLKESAVNDIIAGIKAVAAGERFISPQLSALLLTRHARRDALRQQKPGLDSLTPTEHQVLRRIAANQTSKEIGEALFISPRTVEKHRANISEKLELHGSHALLNFALEHRSELS
jgi:DNA-binding NarL/FixJ family response regulator